MDIYKKRLAKTRLAFFVILLIIFTILGGAFFIRYTGTRIKAAPGVPSLFYAIEPDPIQAGQNFDLVLKVNPNGATFNAFELYTTFDPAKAEFQDMANLANNISSPYILINSSIDTTNNLITIIGTRTGDSFSGTADQEIARVRMRVLADATGDLNFIWDNNNTKVGNKINRDLTDGTFPILVNIPTDTPVPELTPVSETSLLFKVLLPDIIAPNISLSDVQIELRQGSNTIGTTNINLVQSGKYYETGSPVLIEIPQNDYYDIYIKTRVSLGRLFNSIFLTKGQTLDCLNTANTDCGELINQVDNKPSFSGDSDGFNVSSGSYNKIDSADLQVLSLYFNQPAGGSATAANFNLDDQVDIMDLEILGKNYFLTGD